jgi:large subunit ribosomal protein L28
MPKVCEICGKGTVAGHSVSHAHNVTNRSFRANLQRVRASIDGVTRRVWVCTRCLRSDRVPKAAVRTWSPDEALGGAES